jgi:hypothetical protein
VTSATGHVHFVPGETIVWEVTWFDVLVGRIEQSAGLPTVVDGHRAITVRSVGEADGAVAIVTAMRGEGQTIVEMDTGVPLYVAGASFDDVYSGDALDAGLRPRAHQRWVDRFEGGEPAHDTHSALGHLRALRAREGEEAHVHMRINGNPFRAEVRAMGNESISTPLGLRDTARIDGVVTRRRGDLSRDETDAPYPFIVWIANDESRVPVRFHFESRLGPTVVLDLVHYTRPDHPDQTAESIRTVP